LSGRRIGGKEGKGEKRQKLPPGFARKGKRGEGARGINLVGKINHHQD